MKLSKFTNVSALAHDRPLESAISNNRFPLSHAAAPAPQSDVSPIPIVIQLSYIGAYFVCSFDADRAMQDNREFLTIVAFGAAIILGLAGAPLWIAVATGVVYGAEKSGLPAVVSGRHARDQGNALEQAGQVASRIGAILLVYGITLGLRFLGSTWT